MTSQSNIKKTQSKRAEADEILSALIELTWFVESVKNIVFKANRSFKSNFEPAEVISELYLILHEKKPELIIDLYEKKQLRFFTIRILLNMFQSKRHPIWKKCGGMQIVEVGEFSQEEFISVQEEVELREAKNESIVNAVKRAKQNAKEQTIILWNSYQELGRISKVAHLYGTSYRYAENHIKKFKEQVKEYYREEIRKKT